MTTTIVVVIVVEAVEARRRKERREEKEEERRKRKRKRRRTKSNVPGENFHFCRLREIIFAFFDVVFLSFSWYKVEKRQKQK